MIRSSIVEVDAATDPRWARFAEDEGGLFHSAPWAQVLTDVYDFAVRGCLVLDPTGAPTAGVNFVRVDDLRGARTVVLPFSDHANPMARSQGDEAQLYTRLRASGAPARINLLVGQQPRVPAGGSVARRAHWHGVAVAPDAGRMWAALAPATRRAVRKAEREGVRVHRVDDERFLDAFFRLHAGIRKNKYRLLPQPRIFFEAIRDRFSAVRGWWPLVVSHAGRIVAAAVYLQWGQTMYYKFGASDPAALSVRPNDLVLWEGLQLARSRGCRLLDLGRSDEDQPGLARFKRGFGGVGRTLLTVELDGGTGPVGRADRARHQTDLGRITSLLTQPAVPDAAAEVAGSVLYRLFA